MPAFTTPIQDSIVSPSHSNNIGEGNERHPSWKSGNKTVIFGDNMIVSIGNPIDSTKNLLYLIIEFGKTVEYKVNIQK